MYFKRMDTSKKQDDRSVFTGLVGSARFSAGSDVQVTYFIDKLVNRDRSNMNNGSQTSVK